MGIVERPHPEVDGQRIFDDLGVRGLAGAGSRSSAIDHRLVELYRYTLHSHGSKATDAAAAWASAAREASVIPPTI